MQKKGTLYIVAMPIGHPDDITIRAVQTLKDADVIAAEDTRLTARLLSHHHITSRMVSFHEHNETDSAPSLLKMLEEGLSIALVSDAGTPSVSDPGYRLVHGAIEKDIPVIPVPGPSAAIAALSVSGLPSDAFSFLGFPPKKKGRRMAYLQALKQETRTLIFYESPKRILEYIQDAKDVLGDRPAVLCREMTKVYEEYLRGRLSEIYGVLASRPSVKGECTLLIGWEEDEAVPLETARDEIRKELLKNPGGISELSKKIAKKYGLPRNKIYGEALAFLNEKNSGQHEEVSLPEI
jgi:16S rRNA (cytidine1402-2'-O)-methyltransferase